MGKPDSSKEQKACSPRVGLIRCDEKCYTKASASINDVVGMRRGREAFIQGANSRNLYEGPLASLRSPIRVYLSGGGGPVYARRFP